MFMRFPLCSVVFFAVMAMFAVAAPLTPAHAQLRVDVTKGVMEPIPVAVTSFYDKSGVARRGEWYSGGDYGELGTYRSVQTPVPRDVYSR